MVPAVCSWHEHHDAASGEIDRRLLRGERMHVAGPGLVEAYAVLTRLPPPYRVSPSDALALLEASFMTPARSVTLDARAYLRLLRGAPSEGIAGGRAYDGVIAACARAAGRRRCSRSTTGISFLLRGAASRSSCHRPAEGRS
jgi:predicted nucleic acid-binding protein